MYRPYTVREWLSCLSRKWSSNFPTGSIYIGFIKYYTTERNSSTLDETVLFTPKLYSWNCDSLLYRIPKRFPNCLKTKQSLMEKSSFRACGIIPISNQIKVPNLIKAAVQIWSKFHALSGQAQACTIAIVAQKLSRLERKKLIFCYWLTFYTLVNNADICLATESRLSAFLSNFS